jgi:hypothetical protein
MKIIVGIIASDNDSYKDFKNIWVKNILKVKNDECLSKLFDFYFLYSDSKSESKNIICVETGKILYVDFYDKNDKFDNVTHSLFARTMSFFNYMIESLQLFDEKICLEYTKEGLYFLRTNLSTLFDFKLLIKWFEDKPRINLLAGSFNGYYMNKNTTFSGTNMIMTYDIMKYVFLNKEKAKLNILLEDEAISNLIVQNLDMFIINLKRLDFIEMEKVKVNNTIWPATPNSIIYHKTTKGDTDIFTFRFKTFNRTNDINVMNYIVNELWKDDYDLNKVVDNISNFYSPKLPIVEEGPKYGELFSKRCFKIINLNV